MPAGKSTAVARFEVSREEQLLISAAGGRCRPPLDPASPGIRWEKLVTAADWQRLGPLLWEHLREPSADLEVPTIALDVLRELARRSTARSLSLSFELDRVLARLEAEGVPVVLLKGAALVETVYPNPALRPMVDLDLLVPRSDLDRAHLALQEHLGFEVLGARLHRDDERRLETAHHHWPLLSRAGTVVELHHRLLDDRVEYEVGELWERATPSTRGPAHLLPSPEDLALHVAVHFSFDRVHRRESALGQLADLVRIAERWDLDWEVIIERARAARLVHRTFLALTTAAALFGDLAPPELVAPLAPDSYTPERGAAFIRQRVLAEGPSIPLEQIQEMGARRLFPGRSSMERYVRPGEPTPSLTRLRLRRLRAISRRFVTELPRPAALVRDARLSRWIMTLQE